MQSNQSKKTLSAADLAQFTGTEKWYRHSINQSLLYSEGAQYVAEHGGAYWLLDEIALIQPYDKNVAAEEFQVWTLNVRPDNTASLTCDDGNDNVVFSKEIPFTDFPSKPSSCISPTASSICPVSIETPQQKGHAWVIPRGLTTNSLEKQTRFKTARHRR